MFFSRNLGLLGIVLNSLAFTGQWGTLRTFQMFQNRRTISAEIVAS